MQIRDSLLDQFRIVFKGKTLNKYKDKESSLKKDFVWLHDELYNFLILADQNVVVAVN